MIFEKYVSSGNDFIVVEDASLSSKMVKRLCDRHFGIGADGVLSMKRNQTQYEMQIWNADGSKAKMCGNGLKIAGAYLRDKTPFENTFSILIGKKDFVVRVNHHQIGVLLPFPTCLQKEENLAIYELGNRHRIKEVDAIHEYELMQEGRNYPEYNVSYFVRKAPHVIALQTYERGVGLTLSCGSASCCTMMYLLAHQYETKEVRVETKGGNYSLKATKKGIWLYGHAQKVYRGEI